MNTMVSGRAIAYLSEGQVEKMVIPNEATGVFYPMSQRPLDKRFLNNFAWFDYARPRSKEDIFNWRGKKSDMQLKVIKKDNIPLPTLERFKEKEK
jgi:hypothetical protein